MTVSEDQVGVELHAAADHGLALLARAAERGVGQTIRVSDGDADSERLFPSRRAAERATQRGWR